MNESRKQVKKRTPIAGRETVGTLSKTGPRMVEVSKATRRGKRLKRDEGYRRPRSSGGRLRGRASRLAGTVVILCTIVSSLVAVDYVANAGEIHRGVSVGDVALGGKTPAEAREILGRRVSGASGKIDLLVPGGSFTVHIKDLGARVDIGATVGEAYAVGRQGGVLGRLAGRVHALFGVSVPAEVRFRPDAARRKVESLVARADKEARNASVTVSGVRVKVIGSSEGYRLDVPATTENLHRALENLSGEAKVAGKILEPQITTAEAEAVAGKVREATSVPLVLGAEGERWKISPSEVGSALEVAENAGRLSVSLDRESLKASMENTYSALTIEPVEAGYELGGGATPSVSVTPGREGRRIEEETFFSELEAGLFEGDHEYAVPLSSARPELTTARAERLKPTNLLLLPHQLRGRA